MSIKAFLTAAAAGSLILGAGAVSAQETERESRNGVDRPGVTNSTGPLPGTATTGTSSETWQFNRNQSTGATTSSSPGVDTARSNYDSTVHSQTGGQADAFAETAPTPSAANVAVTTEMVASAPVPDTPENRARYGQPLSQTGRMTAPRGN